MQNLSKKHGIVGIKDVDLLILEKLNDKDLLSFCSVDKYANDLCKNEMFWKRRVFEKFGNIKKDVNRTWRNLYLSIVYYKNKYENTYEILSKLHEKGLSPESDIVDYFLSITTSKIYDEIILKLRARERMYLKSLSSSEIESFIDVNQQQIKKRINEMIISYYYNGNIKQLQNPLIFQEIFLGDLFDIFRTFLK
jgi:hypothetical protein